MSERNVEVIQAIYAAFGKGDIPAVLAHVAEQTRWDFDVGPSPVPWHVPVTKKDEVIKILGSPSSVSIFNDKSWYYISRRTGQTAFFEPDVLDQHVFIVDFDDQGVVKTVDHKGVQDARAIDPVPRATPAPGRELTFLEQVIGNVGKFNNAGSSKSSSGSGPTGRPSN